MTESVTRCLARRASDMQVSAKSTLIDPHVDPAKPGMQQDWPLPKPKGGRNAVKVIYLLGDEVMKVFRVE